MLWAIFKRSVPLLASLVLLGILFGSALYAIDLRKAGTVLLSMDASWLCLAFLLTGFTFLINSYRFATIAKWVLDQRLAYRQAVKITWLSSFFALSTPFAAVGDLARAGLIKWLLHTPIRGSVQVVLFDRGFSLFCLVLLSLISSLWCYPYFIYPTIFFAQVLMPIASIMLLVVIFLSYRLIAWPNHRLFNFLTHTLDILFNLLRTPTCLLQQTSIAVGNMLIYAGTVWALSHAIHFSFDLVNLLLFAPLILIVNNLPFFYMGWGGREAAFLMLMPMLAPRANSESMLAVSLGYGMVMMLASLLGGFYLLSLRKMTTQ